MRATLGRDDVHVWYRITDLIDEGQLKAAVSVLSPIEQARHGRFRVDRDRRDYAAAHALLRHSLSRYADLGAAAWEFENGASGKPSIVRHDDTLPALSFNLSHARGIVACAIAPGVDVGVDAEHVDRAVNWPAVVGRYFSPAEIEQLGRCPEESRATRFIELWTLKEAFLKATGAGLSAALNDFGFELEPGATIRFTPPSNVHGADWQFALFTPAPHCRIAIAIASGGGQAWRIAARSSEDCSETAPTYVSQGIRGTGAWPTPRLSGSSAP